MIYLYRFITFLVYYITFPFTGLMTLTGNIKWKQRLGFVEQLPEKKPIVWLHASSVGEVAVAEIIKIHLRNLKPGLTIITTVMTEAGYQILTDKKSPDLHFYLPLDYRSSVRRFLKRIKPDAAVFIETEIWPNMITALGKRNIPVYLANGRLSEKSHRSYRKFRNSLERLFKNYNKLMVQSETDRKRYIEIGAAPEKVVASGSLKFDAPVHFLNETERTEILKRTPFKSNDRIITAGSTRPGEEEIIIDCFKRLRENLQNLKLILAPRHLNRIDEIKDLLEKNNLEYNLYTATPHDSHDVLLVDVIGVLKDLYAISDIAFVGGTLAKLGGHNILEPVWAGAPVLYGPSIDNIRDSSEYVMKHNYGRIITDRGDLYNSLKKYYSGELTFADKTSADHKDSAARKTAETILRGLNR